MERRTIKCERIHDGARSHDMDVDRGRWEVGRTVPCATSSAAMTQGHNGITSNERVSSKRTPYPHAVTPDKGRQPRDLERPGWTHIGRSNGGWPWKEAHRQNWTTRPRYTHLHTLTHTHARCVSKITEASPRALRYPQPLGVVLLPQQLLLVRARVRVRVQV